MTATKSDSAAFEPQTARYAELDEYWLVDPSAGNIPRLPLDVFQSILVSHGFEEAIVRVHETRSGAAGNYPGRLMARRLTD